MNVSNPLVDVTELLDDPEFTEEIVIVHRAPVFDHGVMHLIETTEVALASVQGPSGEELLRYPELAALTNVISVHTTASLSAEQPGGYADAVRWRGEEYIVKRLDEDFKNWGGGWVHAYAVLLTPHRPASATPGPIVAPPATGGP